METSNVGLTFESVNEIYGVTIPMKPLWDYFHLVLFVFQYFAK